MKEKIKKVVEEAIKNHFSFIPDFNVEIAKEAKFGDFATNAAMVLAKREKKAPKTIANVLIEEIKKRDDLFEKIEVAGPGFINLFLKKEVFQEYLKEIEINKNFARNDYYSGKKIMVEFVSANPTGPLHVGHGRGAVLGDVLSNILAASGAKVYREYYINDAGTQMTLLGESVFARYMELFKRNTAEFDKRYYQGEYIIELAQKIKDKYGSSFLEEDKKRLSFFTSFAKKEIMDGIKKDLNDFGVSFDNFFSEKSLYDKGKVQQVLLKLKEKGFIYEKDGAIWFASSQFGDDKDRVLKRSDGEYTYFATDIAYHEDKVKRDFDILIDIWGADHHGYVSRLEAALNCLGAKGKLKVLLLQLVNLIKGGKPLSMSTRAGQFTTLREVVDEVGKDAARFIFLTRRHDSPLDFDLDLAKKKSMDNPVYYVQYAHARISSINREAEKRKISLPEVNDIDVKLLKEDEEIKIIRQLSIYPDLILSVSKMMEPHRLTFYMQELSSMFHKYYNSYRVIQDDKPLSIARLFFVNQIRHVLADCLGLLGVSAPKEM